MGLKRTVDALIEPVSLAEAKAHLKIDSSDEDTYLTALIKTCRKEAETFTGRAFITQTWVKTLDEFPRSCDSPTRYTQETQRYSRGIILLERAPIQSISSISYVDDNGATQPLDSSLYQLETGSDYTARLQPAYGQDWPSTRFQMESVTVTYLAGFGSLAANVPEEIRHAILTYMHFLNEQRGSDKEDLPMPAVTRNLLSPFKIPKFGAINGRG